MKNLSVSTLVNLALAGVGVLLAIIGPFVDWISLSYAGASLGASLKDLTGGDLLGLMKAFAYIAMIVAIASAGIRIAKEFTKAIPAVAEKPAAYAAFGAAALNLIFTIAYCVKNGASGLKLSVSVGVIFVTLGCVMIGVSYFLKLKIGTPEASAEQTTEE